MNGRKAVVQSVLSERTLVLLTEPGDTTVGVLIDRRDGATIIEVDIRDLLAALQEVIPFMSVSPMDVHEQDPGVQLLADTLTNVWPWGGRSAREAAAELFDLNVRVVNLR